MWLGGISVEELMQEYGSPLYVYEEQTIRAQFRKLKQSFPGISLQIHYAMKANPNPALLSILREEGAWVDTLSPWEAQLALDAGFPPEHLLFTGNNVPLEEIDYCRERQIPVNIESLSLLEQFGESYPGDALSLRINPGVGSGHHAHCITGGPLSKFGIYHDQLDRAKELLQQYDLSLTGIHAHIGTGILDPEPMLEAMRLILSIARDFPGLQFIDIGGGFGIPYHPHQAPLDLTVLGTKISSLFRQFCRGIWQFTGFEDRTGAIFNRFRRDAFGNGQQYQEYATLPIRGSRYGFQPSFASCPLWRLSSSLQCFLYGRGSLSCGTGRQYM